LQFNVSLEGRNVDYEAVAKLDGERISSGERISLGRHAFSVAHPKGIGFSTNLTTWYGSHDLGTINLPRATGTLQISLSRTAKSLVIRGPEWRLDLTNSVGGTWSVPTDTYDVEAQFAYVTKREDAMVVADSVSNIRVAPRFGTAHITSSHSDTKFRLSGKNNFMDVSGTLPITLDELPAGEYELTSERLGERKLETMFVTADLTNEMLVAFSYGALTLDTDPDGATVFDAGGRERGRTPITYRELRAGTWQFRLERDGYEPVIAEIKINPSETNHFQTNLLSRQYVMAIERAHSYFSVGQYDEAAKAADEALEHKAGDSVATALKREALENGHLAQAKAFGEHGDYGSALQELKSASESLPENTQIEDLVAAYTEKQKKALEIEAEQKAKQRAQEQREAQIGSLKMSLTAACSRYKGFEAFTPHELTTTKDLKEVAKTIAQAMTLQSPAFETVRYEWQHNDLVMEFKQGVFDGSRQCVIVGGQVSTNECIICFRVIESQTPHGFSWAGGLISAQLTTEEDRNGQRAARFEQQIKEGVRTVEGRIRRVLKSN
jgi:tetratricopeptide (TPR) repeat protein